MADTRAWPDGLVVDEVSDMLGVTALAVFDPTRVYRYWSADCLLDMSPVPAEHDQTNLIRTDAVPFGELPVTVAVCTILAD